MKLTLTLFATLLITSAGAWPAETQPARIGEHGLSLAKRIVFPEVPGDYTVFIRCEAKVLPAGNIEEAGCYGDEKVDTQFYRAVQLASNSATLTPAKVDGKSASVLLLFSVIFRQQGGDRVIAVVPNHGTNAKKFGMNYTAPQRYGRNNQYLPRGEIGLLWVDATMSADGKVSAIEYIDTQWSNKETKRYAKDYMKNNSFIPGFVSGVATDMRFVKPIFGYRNGFMTDLGNSKCGNSTLSCDELSHATGRPRFVFDD